jgi:two-component system, cell cycle sensor histidine kinase and response regulator CckA
VMPDINGMELATRLSETRPGIGVLYTSGYTDTVIAEHGVIRPEIAFIAKPYRLDDLLYSVREAISSAGA